ncbi:nucleoside-diphosphate sugar epimerase [Silanimonas sp.]|uniref:nucleoside-diphosphate sugar epimerase n=1 Tax=Silanimonas sp. TaxID=1929290 RepID=UPI0022C742C9|nr:nucleoside-diphosphate sugar epimerase [Silanimonas sp.]MCZ8164409.1 nucleoside-diphosphate sugar epimerase [Silanimonas sp.]
MRRPPLLVFGLSGQIGDALCRRGLPLPVLAVSRQAREPGAGEGPVEWRASGLDSFDEPHSFEAALSLGPLDAFARAVASGRVRAGRIVAFGSTSLHVKGRSPDAAERDVAARLVEAEAALFAACRQSGTPCTVLRPTLVWGMGRDATVSRVVRLARRWPLLPLPMGAPGLRQPVHALDLADAALAALAVDRHASGAFDLPGGERVAFGEMLRRSVAAGAPGCRPWPVPWPMLAWAGRVDARLGGWASRLADDLVFEDRPAREALGWAPRGFAPSAADFPL